MTYEHKWLLDPQDTTSLDPGAFFPHFIPDSLDQLKGPDTGYLRLPLSAYWGPQKKNGFNLNVAEELIFAYSETITNATVDVMAETLNKNLLITHWKDFFLEPRYVRTPWEQRFPQLKA